MRFVCEPGTFTFAVGGSAADVGAGCQVELTGDVETFAQRDIVSTVTRIAPVVASNDIGRGDGVQPG